MFKKERKKERKKIKKFIKKKKGYAASDLFTGGGSSLQHLNCCVRSLSLWDGHAVRKHRAHEEAQLNQVFESYCPGTRLVSEQASR